MATGPTEVIQSPETGETVEECTGKKKSKFQTFKNFFAKKKRKEPPPPRGESNLKPSQSSSDVSISVLDTTALHSPKEAGPKGSMGNKALSHDSVFIFESAPGSVAGDTLSQENIPGRVKTLQLHLQQNIRLGSPPLVITGKKLEDAGAVSEDDGLPRSPPEISTLHEVLTDSPSKSSNPVQRHSSLSLGGTDSEDEQIPSGASSRPISPSSSATPGAPGSRGSSFLPVDFTIPASPLGCLDTSAARHRIAINPRKQKGFTNKNQQTPQKGNHLFSTNQPIKKDFGDFSIVGAEDKCNFVFSLFSQRSCGLHLVEQLENETCRPATPEKKGNSTELLESDQHKTDWEGLSAQVGYCAKEGSSKETPGVKSPTDAVCDCRDSTLVAEDSCALLQEDACLSGRDHHDKAAAPLLRPEPSPVNLEEHHSAQVSCCSDESAEALKLHQQNTNAEVSALPKLQQIEGEAVVFPDILAADLFSNGVETEGINILADVAQRSSVNSVDPNIKDQEKGDPLFAGKVEACLVTTENLFNHAVSDTAPSTSQVVVADSESSSDIKTVAVLKAENSSVTRNDKETCAITEFQSSKGNAEKKIDTAALVLEAGCMLPPSKLEVCLKAETLSVSKGNQRSQQANTSYNSERLSIGCLASSSLAGLKSNISSDDDSKEYQISSTASHRKTVEDGQSSDVNVKSPLKTASAKPVRFTIAPAWQRSLSGGSNSKEDSYTRSSPTSPIRPELFEGMTKEHTHFEAVTQESAKTNSDRFDRDCRDSDLHLNSSMEWADHEAQNVENPFGVRLRRTSSLLKYQSESRAESPKLIPSAVPTASSSASVKEDQKSVGTGKPPPGLPISTKSFVKKTDLLQDKNSPKTRPEEVAKKQNGHKPSEKVSSLHLETASSEPAWVSMAKLKQKGFQDHPLAKEHKAEDKALTKVDQEEQGIYASENILKKNMPSSLSSQDKKMQMKTSVSAAAGKVGPIAQEASVIPAVEKEARHSSNLPMTPCSSAEPPWLSLAKKKAKAWSEMPQICSEVYHYWFGRN
ncbi:acrosomal protein KIAA1210 homolog isoform X5 [Accipiter gentilis]|nr:acrosomal protein KIAA1210 homolog isoform X5 [Accipiter gentilis]XP_049684179.1 acrosomal protein KIAA1210 homolog isoform X5 [Accipiter gentilis]XP_049684180.1 acrosomal protein KIAA1210 homolog isoform X5 [Accipiter gentilis]XP_049684181.1 acrosomal protein KIAA1210 homolog isoform X5 [Accipiter gentilis]